MIIQTMQCVIVFLLIHAFIAEALICPTCFGNNCQFRENIQCSSTNVKKISGFCADFDERYFDESSFVCLSLTNNYNYNPAKKESGCFHAFNDREDGMCDLIHKLCDRVLCEEIKPATSGTTERSTSPVITSTRRPTRTTYTSTELSSNGTTSTDIQTTTAESKRAVTDNINLYNFIKNSSVVINNFLRNRR